MNINSETKQYCLIGDPIKNSFSPEIHNYLFDKNNINSIYTCIRIEKENLMKFVDGAKVMDIKGFNVTVPHKVDIISFLDEIDSNAIIIGAVNTVKNENGILKGYNTDGRGFLKAITDRGMDIKGKKALIIGAGGAARSIAVELASAGIGEIGISNRTIEKAEIIKNIVESNFETKVGVLKEKPGKSYIEKFDYLINTTSMGMDSNECPIDKNINVDKKIAVYDIVYKPHKTELIKWAEKNNLDIIYGIEMLINQGFEAFEIWTGVKPNKQDCDYLIEKRVL